MTETTPMPPTRALLFDVFGTLVDWRASMLDQTAELGVDADWPVIVDDWRRAYRPALDQVRSEPQWRDLDAVHRQTLDGVLDQHGVGLPTDQKETLVQGWRRLRPWPDTRDGLERLRGDYRLATLSNGHLPLLVELFRFGDLRVDALLSSQLADSYKPDPKVYLRGAELLGYPPGEVGMVAAHADDLEAAAQLGLRPLFVRRPAEWGPAGGDEPPHGLPGLVIAEGLVELADVLATD